MKEQRKEKDRKEQNKKITSTYTNNILMKLYAAVFLFVLIFIHKSRNELSTEDTLIDATHLYIEISCVVYHSGGVVESSPNKYCIHK